MTDAYKVKVLYSILRWAPMVESKPEFRQYAEARDLGSFWRYYENSIKARQDVRSRVESSGEVSFEALRPAMEAVYKLRDLDLISGPVLYQFWSKADLQIIPDILLPIESHLGGAAMNSSMTAVVRLYDEAV